jgi:hypothetical protein
LRKHLRLITAAAMSVAAVFCVEPTAAAVPAPKAAIACPPGLGIGLAEEPKALVNDPRAKHYIVDFVRPGTTLRRKVIVCNGDGQAAHIQVFGDGATINSGTFALADAPGADPISAWTTVAPGQLTLPPHTGTLVTATIAVPKDAPAGEFYGGVVAARPATGSGVAISARAAVRIYLAVGTGGLPPVNFTVDTLTAQRDAQGVPVVQALVHNTGKRAVDLSGTLKLDKGPSGLSGGPFPVKLGTTLAPGQSEPVTVTLDKTLPAGPWHARIDLQSGLLRRAAEATITFPTQAGTSAPPVRAKSIPLTKNRHFLIPLALLLLLLLAIGLLLLLWKRRRRDDDQQQKSNVAMPTESISQ